MSYATLMVHVDLDEELSGRVKVAADLAERFRAHLIGVAGWAPMSVFLAEEARSDPAASESHLQDMIPAPFDQNPCAHWRRPMDMILQGWSTSLFHASQQWSTRSS